ncbi:MAG: hypothetical protein SPL15_03625 [Lachnospiraceae bacterium]|nr:hypothetical protein [Lachnospiraceae bacterium]MDY5742068.1 hypothetical protein [Lachnospiraceae bacterium]
MQRRQHKITPKRLVMAFWGVFLTGICIGLFQKASLGTDPFTSLVTGIANIFSSTYGRFYMVVTGGLLIGVALLQRGYIGIATILNLTLTGVTADTAKRLLDLWLIDPPLWLRALMLMLALTVACLSASLYFTADLGVSAYDAWALMGGNEYRIASFRVCRVALDSVCVLIGLVFGANIGIGTVLQALCMGPVVHWFNIHLSEPLLVSEGTQVTERR